MADNVPVHTDPSGPQIATDDVGGVQFQVVKLDVGGDGVSTPVVGGSRPAAQSLPVALASDQVGTGLTQEETNQGILILLSQILEKLPRLDANDRLLASLAENTAGTVNVAGSLTGVTTVTTVATVTTAADVTRINNFGPNTAGLNMSASYFMQHAANAGSVHIYNQIAVS